MSKKILTSIDPSEITINFFSRIFNILKSSIHNIITPPKPGNKNPENIEIKEKDLEEPLIRKVDSIELIKF